MNDTWETKSWTMAELFEAIRSSARSPTREQQSRAHLSRLAEYERFGLATPEQSRLLARERRRVRRNRRKARS